MTSRIDPEQLASVRAVESFLRAGRFRYALAPIRSTGALAMLTWVDWVALPEVDRDLAPGVFHEAVESLELGLLLETRTTRDAFRWLEAAGEPIRLGLTVSGASLAQADLAQRVVGLMEASGTDPRRICFNVAVTAALSDLSGTTRFVKAVRRAGCLVTLCNGIPGNPVLGLYGPLGYVNHLRIDRGWIEAAPESRSHRQTLESIIDYARRLRLRVIAEGVDRKEQLELISSMGIDYYSGNLLGRPALVAESGGENQPLVRLAAR